MFLLQTHCMLKVVAVLTIVWDIVSQLWTSPPPETWGFVATVTVATCDVVEYHFLGWSQHSL